MEEVKMVEDEQEKAETKTLFGWENMSLVFE